jgi:nucleoid DNA-binding protein
MEWLSSNEEKTMFQSTGFTLAVWCAQFGLTPVSVARRSASLEEAALVFSGPKFLVALLAGVMMAFAFQLLLTNFSVAFGLSSGGQSDDDEESLGSTIRQIETKLGFWALVTVSIALFVACFLAVKLSLVDSTILGAITGVVIWSTYFSLLVWIGSTAVGSLVGSVVSTATSGLQGLVGTTVAAVGANAAKDRAVSTAEAVAAAVRRELISGIDANSIQETLKNSLGVPLPLDVREIRNQFEKILRNSDLQAIADGAPLDNINRQTFVDLISSRTDLSKQDVNQIADQLEGAWQQVVGQQGQQDTQTELLNLLKTATPEELSERLSAKTEQLTGGGRGASGLSQLTQLSFDALMGALLGRVDLSKVDVEKLSGQLKKLKDSAIEQAGKMGSQDRDAVPSGTIAADVDDYLLNSLPWHLNRESIKDEFKDVIYDPEADPRSVRQQLEQLNRDYFVQKLTSRNDFPSDRVAEVAEQLEGIRTEVLSTARTGESEAQSQDLRSRVENYLRSTGKAELNPEGIQRDFKQLLEDPDAGIDALSQRLSQFDRDTFVQLLKERQDLSEEEAEGIVSQLESTRDSVLTSAEELQAQAKSRAEELRNKVEGYLRDTNKEELNPEGIERDLRTLLDDPQAGLSALRTRLSQFDRDTLVQLLSQRQDLSEEQVNQVLDSIERVRGNILQPPQKLAGKAKEQYEQTTSAIAEYLRNTNLEELDPEGIKRDLAKLFDDPNAGTAALRTRLAQVDRETLVKLLSQRGELSEEQVNGAIDRVQEAINSTIAAPRRLAARTTQQVRDFQANFESYLRNTNKEELNPEGIKRDLQLLLKDPQGGWENIGDRLSQFDRSTLVALLSQREDISEEEANQIADRIESVRNSIVNRAREVQQAIQSALDGIFAKIRNYLNSLDRPELNYEGIERDFSKLFDDPQAGFEALRDRLSQFDRDTLVAVLSSREDISEADANRIIDSIEKARDRVLQQTERIQQETQKRLQSLKLQTQKQAKETQKAAVGAAWWLFSTALTSLAASAIAGALAITRI